MIEEDHGDGEQSARRASHLTHLASGGSASFVGIVVNSVLGFGLVVLAGHSLSQAKAGSLFEAIAIFTILTSIAVFGADVGLLRFVPSYRHDRPREIGKLFMVALGPPALEVDHAHVLQANQGFQDLARVVDDEGVPGLLSLISRLERLRRVLSDATSQRARSFPMSRFTSLTSPSRRSPSTQRGTTSRSEERPRHGLHRFKCPQCLTTKHWSG